MIKSLVHQGIAAVAVALAKPSKNDLRVLMYHRVDEPDAKPHLAPCTLSATPKSFEQQMRYIVANHNVVSIHDVLRAIDGVQDLPERAVLITFDDGYQCFAKYAWPVLFGLSIPSLLFIPTSYPNQRKSHFWWDTIHRIVNQSAHDELSSNLGEIPVKTPSQKKLAISRLSKFVEANPSTDADKMIHDLVELNGAGAPDNDVMDWSSICELVKQGLDLGGHTVSHPMLIQLEKLNAEKEIAESMTAIRRQTGYHAQAFAYPNGAYNQQTIEIIQKLGIKLAFTTCRGSNEIGKTDPCQLRRINIGQRATMAKIKAQLHMNRAWFNSLFRTPFSDAS